MKVKALFLLHSSTIVIAVGCVIGSIALSHGGTLAASTARRRFLRMFDTVSHAPEAYCTPVGTAEGFQANGTSLRGAHHRYGYVCADVPVDIARCHSILVLPDEGQDMAAAAVPAGYQPTDLQSAYNLPSSSGGNGQTIAIVDAYDDPNAEADLDIYGAQFRLPPCTTVSGCFRKVNERGKSDYPRADTSWAQEISLDLDMVSAICPNCHILLVETSSASLRSLGTAVNTAARLGATAISNSYGGAV